jgi:hypothetical protein
MMQIIAAIVGITKTVAIVDKWVNALSIMYMQSRLASNENAAADKKSKLDTVAKQLKQEGLTSEDIKNLVDIQYTILNS